MVSSSNKMTPWLMAFFCLATAGCSNVTDQQTSETHHDHQVAILKQIRKVNEDGSYTYGYEAGDGSFKEHVSVVQSIPRINRTSTTRKPNIVYATTTESPTRASVVQSIPRTRKTTTTGTTTTTTSTTTTEAPKTIFGHYLKGTPKSRPRFVINGQQRPIVIEEGPEDEDSQINRPSTDDKSGAYRRIIFAKRPIEHSLPPISEDFVEKEDDAKITTGNTLRRQLHDETTKSSSITDDSDDHSDVYGGSLSTTRPLFTTTAPSRVLQRVSSTPRTERPKFYVNRQENLGAGGRFDNPKYEDSRIYETDTKPTQEERTSTQQILLRTSTARIPTETRDYVRQSTEPVFLRQQPEQYLPSRILVQSQQGNLEEDGGVFRGIPIGRLLLRPPSNHQPVYSTTTDANVHYLTENPVPDPEDEARIAMNMNYMRSRPVRPLIYPEPEQRARPVLRPIPSTVTHPDERDYQATTPEYPFRAGALALPPEPPNPIAPPLSRRDFQVLLRRLLVSQYGVQALSYPKSFLEDALYDQQPYPSYPAGYQAPLPRPELAYDQQAQYGDRVPLRRPVYPRALSPLYHPQYDDYHDRYPKRVYRQKFYTQDVADEGDEILPATIREALLLRMVNLAINTERSTMVPITTTPASRYRKTGPVRSVQIITDDDEEDKDLRKKM
ncbi:PREDICTED: uncharacterized protein LOC105568446 isoform X3 [Vollenhovia emeryi]|uniref:uncharacterized protein LOC105568446 isoform X3 n=1 Tax=Vollenhovia emeryi TaxID=411798 RepID=UPI0005F4C60A|nr:PREDICTED: uncharacterized protein LOC105568446 isoform X3 [Vollenhovia emeryi]